MFLHQAASLQAGKEVWLHPQLRLQSLKSPGTTRNRAGGLSEAGVLYSLGFVPAALPPLSSPQGLQGTSLVSLVGQGMTPTQSSPHHTLTRVVQQQLWAPGQA